MIFHAIAQRSPEWHALRVDRTGQKSGRLTVKKYIGKTKDGHSLWLCKCECGASCNVASNALGRTQSCGCLAIETARMTNRTHGCKDTPEYRSWSAMLVRCRAKTNKDYPRYGARGIRVCRRWYQFENFLADMGPRPSLAYSIDRKNNEGPYCKRNCRWATAEEQANNRRSSAFLTIGRETLTISQWARRHGFPIEAFRQRIKRGWPIEDAFSRKFHQ